MCALRAQTESFESYRPRHKREKSNYDGTTFYKEFVIRTKNLIH